MTWLFRTLLTASLLATATALYFFVWGLLDGSVSSFNMALWIGLLAVVMAIPAGGYGLRAAGYPRIAIGVLLITALPALAYLLFILAMLIFQPRWN